MVAENLSTRMDVTTVDLDPEMVRKARSRGIISMQGDASDLPFEDGSFDIVYCSFLLLWTKDPIKAIKEMSRVSKDWVICLAEPDHGGRIDHPSSLEPLRDIVVEGMRREGADPFMGRKLREIFHHCGLEPFIGVHPGVWDIGRLRSESDYEWNWLVRTAGSDQRLKDIKPAWDRALADGSMFQFNPIFYALARKERQVPGLGSRQA